MAPFSESRPGAEDGKGGGEWVGRSKEEGEAELGEPSGGGMAGASAAEGLPARFGR